MKPSAPSALLPAFALAAATLSPLVCGLAPAARADSRQRTASHFRAELDGSPGPAAREICERFLEGNSPPPRMPRLELTPVANLIPYLAELAQGNHLGTPELERMRTALVETGQLVNPYSDKTPGTLTSAQLIAQEGIEPLIQELATLGEREGKTQLERFLEWLDETLARKEHVRARRKETREETRSAFRKVTFHPIPPGKFEMGQNRKRVSVELTHPFELMETDVTQSMWVELMVNNPSEFQDGDEAITIGINGRAIKMLPDHPVENITWWSAVVFANRLSETKKLPPAYDVSRITWDPDTRAEDGTLQPVSEDEAIELLQINATGGNIYQAQGFRLPTDAEWEYVLKSLVKSKCESAPDSSPDDISEEELPDYAWHEVNSDDKPHAVGTTAKFFGVNGRVFFDLLGNVSKWSHDGWSSSPSGGINPSGPRTGCGRVSRGGSWLDPAQSLRSTHRSKNPPFIRFGFLGFRLARTLPPQNQRETQLR